MSQTCKIEIPWLLLGLPKVGLRNPELNSVRDGHNSAASEDVLRILPVQPFQEASLDCYDWRISDLDHVSVQDPTTALVAEVAFLLPPTIAHTREVRDIGIVFDTKEREDGGCAKGGGRLATTVDTMTVVEIERCGSRGGEGNGAARTLAVHDG